MADTSESVDQLEHPEWIFSEQKFDRIVFDQLESPEEANFYVKVYDEEKKEYVHTDPLEKRAVTKEELDTIVLKEPIRIIDRSFSFPVHETFIRVTGFSEKGVTLRDFIETLCRVYTGMWEAETFYNPKTGRQERVTDYEEAKKQKIHFLGVGTDRVIVWDYFSSNGGWAL